MDTQAQQRIWVQDPENSSNWNLTTDDPFYYGYVHQYPAGGYCWQQARGSHRIAGLANTWDDATREAEAAMAMPQEEFAQIALAKYEDDLKRLVEKMQELSPTSTPLLPAYKAGYEAGQTDLRKRIAEALA